MQPNPCTMTIRPILQPSADGSVNSFRLILTGQVRYMSVSLAWVRSDTRGLPILKQCDSVQKPGARLLRVALVMTLYKLMFGDDEPRPDQVVLTYRTTWKILFCLLLFFAADMIKVILTKIMAGHFHNQLHFLRMQDALNKVTYTPPDIIRGPSDLAWTA